MRPLLRFPPLLLAPLAALMLSACAPAPIYKVPANAVAATPMQVARTPENYAHGQVIWGGTVVSVTNFPDRTEIEVLALPLDGSQRPRLNATASGRFIAVIPGYVEPLNYPPGAPITVSGTLNGSRAGHVGEASYVFPLVKVVQAHRWTASEMTQGRNNVHFGLGLGVGIR
ncbi:Slp family lipoprotein [Dyella sp. A6]|uniref:Slp family lipoprotein n=1 Tax=Dyella aluminiiresistens TaxID=3069105 RepID=UPI002E76AFF2|nr:Slp family lipoprotein [Dyella sp. A6]